jgi:hypothetical protein
MQEKADNRKKLTYTDTSVWSINKKAEMYVLREE